jgi:ketosteroid isomerase-like protein
MTEINREQDREDVRTVLYDYAYYIDMNMIDELAALFVDDCSVSYGPGFGADGKSEYLKTLDGVGTFFSATSHHVSNVVIHFEDDDTAIVRSVLYAWHRYNRDRPDGHLWGQYHDVMVRTSEGWRVRRRELRTTGVRNFHTKPEMQTPIGRRQ